MENDKIDKKNNKLFWIFKIDDGEDNDKRIFVEYLPVENKIFFRGQVKDGTLLWVDVTTYTYNTVIDVDVLETPTISTAEPVYKKIKQDVFDDIDMDEILLFVYEDILTKIKNIQKLYNKISEYEETIDNKTKLIIKIRDSGEEYKPVNNVIREPSVVDVYSSMKSIGDD